MLDPIYFSVIESYLCLAEFKNCFVDQFIQTVGVTCVYVWTIHIPTTDQTLAGLALCEYRFL